MSDPDFEAQLFHTYTVVSRHDPPLSDHMELVMSGRLRLYPHGEADVSTDPDWSEDPLQDANWRFQYHSLIWLDRLREAGERLHNPRATAHYERLLKSWIESNPVGEPASDYSWFDMATGLRVIVLAFAVRHFGRETWLLSALETHAEQLADPANYDSRGNHGLHQDLGLLVAAQILGHAEWIEKATDRIVEMFREAIDEEGVCREGCVDYQYRNYRWYQEALRRLRAAGARDVGWMEDRLALMPEFLAHATSPTGNYALLGDTLLHSAPRVEGTSADWVRDRSQSPQSPTRCFSAGYIFARKTWRTFEDHTRNAFLTQRFGPGRSTAVHGHEDAGAITLDVMGESLLRDSGLYAYEAGDERLYFRGRSSHNVVDVPGRAYYPSAEAELRAYAAPPGHVYSTVRVVGLQGVEWYRTLLWVQQLNLIMVDDRVKLDREDVVRQLWHLPPGARLIMDTSAASVTVNTLLGACLRIQQAEAPLQISTVSGGRDPIEGWLSTAYRSMEPAPTLSFENRASSARFSTVLSYRDTKWRVQVTSLKRTSLESILAYALNSGSGVIRLSSSGFEHRRGGLLVASSKPKTASTEI